MVVAPRFRAAHPERSIHTNPKRKRAGFTLDAQEPPPLALRVSVSPPVGSAPSLARVVIDDRKLTSSEIGVLARLLKHVQACSQIHPRGITLTLHPDAVGGGWPRSEPRVDPTRNNSEHLLVTRRVLLV